MADNATNTMVDMSIDAQVKEKFEKGVGNTDLLALINSWEAESDDFYSVLKQIWEENIAYYNGLQTGVEKITGKRSKAVENRIFMAIETIIPIATSRLPDIVVKADENNEQAVIDATDTQDVLAYQFERVRFQELAERWVRDILTKRYGVFKVSWDKYCDDVGIKVVDPRRIRLPKYGKCVYDLKFILEDLELTYESMVDYFGKEKADRVVKLNPAGSDMKQRKKTFSITEAWTNEFVAWKVGNEILDKKENPYVDAKNKENNFFIEPHKPYIIKSLFETEESLIGSTDYIQQVKFLQDNLNVRRRQTEDILTKVADPALLIDSDVISEEEVANITNEPGLIIYGKDAAAGTKVRFEAPGQVSPALFSDMNDTRAAIDNILGTHSTTRGEREGRETLGGRQMLREADLGRIDLIGRVLERSIDEIAEWWMQLMKMFYTEQKAFSILGEDGIRFVTDFMGTKIGKIKPMVKVGSTLKEDDAALNQRAILLWQNKAIGLRTLYKMLKLPNMSEAIEDWQQTNNGELLRGGQAQGPGQVPVTPPGGTPMGAPAGGEVPPEIAAMMAAGGAPGGAPPML